MIFFFLDSIKLLVWIKMKFCFIIFVLLQCDSLFVIASNQQFIDNGPICNPGWYWDPRCGDNKNETMHRSVHLNESMIIP